MSWCREVDWGSAPDWVAAIAALIAAVLTGIALIVAARSYRDSTRDAHEAQARLVYSTVDAVTTYQTGELIDGGERTVLVDFVASSDTTTGSAVVTALMPAISITVSVKNNSSEVIAHATIRLISRVLDDENDLGCSFAAITPGTEEITTLILENHWYPGLPTVGSEILFRDSGGSWWTRQGADPVIELKGHSPNENWVRNWDTSGERRLLAVLGWPTD